MEANDNTKERNHLHAVQPEPPAPRTIEQVQAELAALKYRIIRPLIVRSSAMLKAKRALQQLCETQANGLATPIELGEDIAALAVMWNLLHGMIERNSEILRRVEQWEALAPVEPPEPPAA
jgi:hypothetical protein